MGTKRLVRRLERLWEITSKMAMLVFMALALYDVGMLEVTRTSQIISGVAAVYCMPWLCIESSMLADDEPLFKARKKRMR